MLKSLYPYVALAVLLALVGAFFYGMNVGADRSDAKHAKTEALIAKVREQAQQGAATEISKIKIVNQTHKQVLEREIRNVPVYTDCRNTPDGVRAINGALSNEPVPAGSGVVPEADPAR